MENTAPDYNHIKGKHRFGGTIAHHNTERNRMVMRFQVLTGFWILQILYTTHPVTLIKKTDLSMILWTA